MPSSKQIDLQRNFAAGVHLSEVQNPPPPPPTHWIRVYTIHYTVYLFTQGRGIGGELNQREGERGNSSKIPT